MLIYPNVLEGFKPTFYTNFPPSLILDRPVQVESPDLMREEDWRLQRSSKADRDFNELFYSFVLLSSAQLVCNADKQLNNFEYRTNAFIKALLDFNYTRTVV